MWSINTLIFKHLCTNGHTHPPQWKWHTNFLIIRGAFDHVFVSLGSYYMALEMKAVCYRMCCVWLLWMKWDEGWNAQQSDFESSCSWSKASITPQGLKQTATIKTGFDPWENICVFVSSDHKWMVVIEWCVMVGGNRAQSGAAVCEPPLALWCL